MAAESSEEMREIQGSCHCGNIRFVYHRPGLEGAISVRACGCSFCQKNQGVWTSHAQGWVALAVGDPAQINRYTFGTGTADFYICTNCGGAPVATSEIDGEGYAVVNVNCVDGIDRSEFAETATDFDGESTEGRLVRRQRNWSRLETER